jgi:spermidine synthase
VIRGDAPTVLIGGLGFGHTLRAALKVLPPKARVFVAELIPEIVEWNRTLVKDVSDNALSDPRVRVEVEDVRKVLARSSSEFNVVLLDVDNGPFAVTRPQNAALYEVKGAKLCNQAMKRRSRLVVWSAGEDPQFEKTLKLAHFNVSRKNAEGHVLFVADKD